jgi:hypothetical protein
MMARHGTAHQARGQRRRPAVWSPAMTPPSASVLAVLRRLVSVDATFICLRTGGPVPPGFYR